jgi:hypothetical protein
MQCYYDAGYSIASELMTIWESDGFNDDVIWNRLEQMWHDIFSELQAFRLRKVDA